MKDKIIEEIHKHREEYAKKFNYDIDLIFADLKLMEAESGRTYVSFVDKKSPEKKAQTKKAKDSKKAV